MLFKKKKNYLEFPNALQKSQHLEQLKETLKKQCDGNRTKRAVSLKKGNLSPPLLTTNKFNHNKSNSQKFVKNHPTLGIIITPLTF